MPPAPSPETLKRAAAREALERVRSGMRLGLGSGSTVAHFLELLGERLQDGGLRDVVGVPTSVQTADRAHVAGIPIATLPELAPLDLTVDGADEVTPSLDLIKGLGGALLREKMVAGASRRFLVIADAAKCVQRLGTLAPLPVEVASFAWPVHLPFLESLGCRPLLRSRPDGSAFTTDNGNHVIDCRFPDGLPEGGGLRELEERLALRPGVIESGLFLGMASEAVIAGADGIRVLEADARGAAGQGGR